MPKSRLRYMPPPPTMTTQFNASAYEATKSYLGNPEYIRPQSLYDYNSISSSIKKEPTSLWHSVLALPFDDQKLGRRELSTCGRSYAARAGIFSSEFQQQQQKTDKTNINEQTN